MEISERTRMAHLADQAYALRMAFHADNPDFEALLRILYT